MVMYLLTGEVKSKTLFNQKNDNLINSLYPPPGLFTEAAMLIQANDSNSNELLWLEHNRKIYDVVTGDAIDWQKYINEAYSEDLSDLKVISGEINVWEVTTGKYFDLFAINPEIELIGSFSKTEGEPFMERDYTPDIHKEYAILTSPISIPLDLKKYLPNNGNDVSQFIEA